MQLRVIKNRTSGICITPVYSEQCTDKLKDDAMGVSNTTNACTPQSTAEFLSWPCHWCNQGSNMQANICIPYGWQAGQACTSGQARGSSLSSLSQPNLNLSATQHVVSASTANRTRGWQRGQANAGASTCASRGWDTLSRLVQTSADQ